MPAPSNTAVIDAWTAAGTPPTSWANEYGDTNDFTSSGSGYIYAPGSATLDADYYTGAGSSVGPDFDLYIQLLNDASFLTYIDLSARGSSMGGASVNEYFLRARNDATGWQIFSRAAGTPTTLATGSVQAIAVNGYAWFSGRSTTLTGYYSSDGTNWTQIVQVTDSTYTTAGSIAVGLNYSTGGSSTRFGPLHGGTVTSGPPLVPATNNLQFIYLGPNL